MASSEICAGCRQSTPSLWDPPYCTELCRIRNEKQPGPGTLGQQAATWLRSVAYMLEKKNQAYGDSAGQPVRVFSKADMIEQLKVRADDKLSRLTRGTAAGEDAVMDLVGYIALLAAAGWKGNG